MTHEGPRYQIVPTSARASEDRGLSAVALADGYGLTLDDWQADIVRAWMRTEGPTVSARWCASTWGASVSRQNGKNGGLEAVELYLMAVMGYKILHTAHLLGTARKAFKRLQLFFGREVNDPNARFPELNALVVEMRKTNGQEAIELSNGGLIELTARTSGGGRGTTFDVVVVDEAQEYEEDEQEALEPATSATPSGQPITIYMGTPPKVIGERGEPFVRVRNGAVTGASKSTAWVEHGAPGDVDSMKEPELAAFVRDRTNWAIANPAYPHRVSEAAIEGELERMSPRSFARERLNMWPAPRESNIHPIAKPLWEKRKTDEDTSQWPLAAVGLDMNPERTKVTITMAYWRPGAGVHVEIAAEAPYNDAGASALVEWVWARCKRRIPVVMDAFSPLRSVQPLLLKKGMKVRVLDASEWGQACMGLHDAVRDGEMTHFDQTQLNLSVLGAVKEAMGKGGAWKFARQSVDVDLGPVVSATCALFGAIKFGRRPRAEAEKTKRHAMVL